MRKQRKDFVFKARIDSKLLDKAKHLMERTGLTQSELLRTLIDKADDESKKQQEEQQNQVEMYI